MMVRSVEHGRNSSSNESHHCVEFTESSLYLHINSQFFYPRSFEARSKVGNCAIELRTTGLEKVVVAQGIHALQSATNEAMLRR